MKKVIALLVVVVACAACLKAENRHAFYLESDGSATWAVMEEEVRSDAGERAERIREEAEYLRSAQRGETEIANALRHVGATSVKTTVVRDTPPYTVLTEARFESSAKMLQSFLEAIGFEAEAALWFDGERTTLSFRFRESDGDKEGGEIGNGPADCLIEPEERYRFVLTEGTFIDSSGFRLEARDTVAVMLDLDEVEEDSEPGSVSFSLTWTSDR